MKNSFLLCTSLIALLLMSGIDTFSQSSRSFKAGNGGTLDISTTFGDIHINTWDKSEILVKYDIDEDDAIYNDIKFNQNGNNLTIKADDGIGTSFRISVPTNFNLKLTTQAGDIILANSIIGEINAITSSGDVLIKNVSGQVILKTSGGDIKTGNIGGNVKLSSAGGNLKTGVIDGDAQLTTGGGNVIISNANKTLSVSTGGGNVTVGSTGGATKVTTGGGNVGIGKINGGAIITTGGGDIKIENVSGDVKTITGGGDISVVSTNDKVNIHSGAGNVAVSFYPGTSGESKIGTGYGDINLYIPENSRTTVIAAIKGRGWIDSKDDPAVMSDFVSTTVNKTSNSMITTYKLNGGGSIVHLETGSGTIEIRKLKK